MEKIKVEDLYLKSMAYDSDSNILELEFNDGEIRHYHGVSDLAYNLLINSESPGGYFHDNIASNYPFEIVQYAYANLR